MSESYHWQSGSGNNINALSYCFADNKKNNKNITSTDKIVLFYFLSLSLSIFFPLFLFLSYEVISSAHFREKIYKAKENEENRKETC